MKSGVHWPQTIAVLAALSIVQSAVFDQFWFAGRVRIDLLLLLVVSIGSTSSPRDAALVGFVAGLVVDLMRFGPFGLHALVFCLAGWVLANNGVRMLQVGAGFRLAQGAVSVLLVTAATWTAAAVFGQRPPAFGNEAMISIALTAVVGALLLGPIGRLASHMVPADQRRPSRPDTVRA